MRKKILTVLGARPQFIKAATVTRALREISSIEEIVVHTGQHYDHQMSDVFFEELQLGRPTYHLGVGSGSHAVQTARILEGTERVIAETRPDRVLVYGDTNSTIAAALAAAKLQIPIAHVEAGLRSFNRAMPEEINRIVTDHLSDLLFAPTDTAASQLLKEGFDGAKIHQTGDVMHDSALFFREQAIQKSRILEKIGAKPNEFILATIHRASNTDDPVRLASLVHAFTEVARTRQVVWPVHPRTRAAAATAGISLSGVRGLLVIEPVGYLDMISLEMASSVIVTDSGGVQKEAFFFEIPCVTLREETEWVETVAAGWNRLVSPGAQQETISREILAAIGRQGKQVSPYGDGTAARKIAEKLA